jgi:hypothetical protein
MILHPSYVAAGGLSGRLVASDTEAFVTQETSNLSLEGVGSDVGVSTVDSAASYRAYQKVLIFIAVWVLAVVLAVFMIDVPEVAPIWQSADYHHKFGYTYSLVLLFLPLAFLVLWYFQSRDSLDLRALMRQILVIVVFSALAWILLDILLANLLFSFPDQNAHVQLTLVPGYLWSGECSTFSKLWRFPACYFPPSIPLEEVLFYLGGAGLLTMMYMWASEDFYSEYTLPRPEYTRQAKAAPPLIYWNKWFIFAAIALAVLGVLIKKFGWWHPYHEGWPYYLFAELVIVFLPLAALYTRVHKFTNPRAFIFVMLVHVQVSVIWETTLALPFGWWDYRPYAMMGVVIEAWSRLAIEATGLWLSVGWASMFTYEATKIKVVSGKSWREVLFG